MGGQTADSRDGKLRASQSFPGQFIGFDDTDFALDRRIGAAQIGGFIGLYHAIQRYKIGDIASGISVFLHDVFSFAQGRRHRHTVFIGGHGSSQAETVGVILVNIKLNALDGGAIQFVCLDNLDITLGRFILAGNRIGLVILAAGNRGAEMIVHKMHRHFAFLHFVHTPGQEIGNGLAIAIRYQHSDHFTVVFPFMGGQTAFPRDRKLRAC